jgi:hypothetical protein
MLLTATEKKEKENIFLIGQEGKKNGNGEEHFKHN